MTKTIEVFIKPFVSGYIIHIFSTKNFQNIKITVWMPLPSLSYPAVPQEFLP
jgi:hypothetical protein